MEMRRRLASGAVDGPLGAPGPVRSHPGGHLGRSDGRSRSSAV